MVVFPLRKSCLVECKLRGVEYDISDWDFYVHIDVELALESEVLEVGGEGKTVFLGKDGVG